MKQQKIRKNPLSRLFSTMSRAQTAITYAESGSYNEAMEAMDAPRPRSAVMALGNGRGFSQALMDYTVGLADRLDFDIVAVSARYLPTDGDAAVVERLKAEFAQGAQQAAISFEQLARDKGVEFTHLVKYGEGTDVIRDLHKQFSHLEYVVSEPDDTQAEGEDVTIPVFSLAMS